MDHNRTITRQHKNSSTELLTIPLESSFPPEDCKSRKESIILHVPHEASDELSALVEKEFDSIVSKSSTDVDVGRTNLFKMDIPSTGPPIAHKPYPYPLKY